VNKQLAKQVEMYECRFGLGVQWYFGQCWILFTLSSRFKSTCNETGLKWLVISNSTGVSTAWSEIDWHNCWCPSRPKVTYQYWGRLSGLDGTDQSFEFTITLVYHTLV